VTIHAVTVLHDHAGADSTRDHYRMRLRPHALATLAVVATVLVLGGSTASAHDPVILEPAQASPSDGPLLVDGTVSFALYGTVNGSGDTRGFRVRYAAGQTFNLSALVPNLEPEQAMPVDQYPTITVVTPSGERIELEPSEVSTFDEPFTKTSYRRYLEWSTVAVAGDYGVIVTGVAPARFTVSTGVKEQFGTAIENIANRDLGVAGVMEWYATPPPVEPVPTTTVATVATTGTSDPQTTTSSLSSETTVVATTDGDAGGSGGQAPVVAIVVVLLVAIGSAVAVWLTRRRT
jgi:hypothetical protein